MKVPEVRYGNDSAEVMTVQVLVKGGEENNIMTVYVLPKNKKLGNKVRYSTMLEDSAGH